MAVNKLPQAFDVEPMRLGDVDAVMAIEKSSFRSPLTAQLLLDHGEVFKEWADELVQLLARRCEGEGPPMKQS